MLGIGGKFAASKGMVLVPNLSGLSSANANLAITNAGLFIGSNTSTSTSNSSLNDTIASQSVPAGTLVEYESLVGYSVYSYVAPPAPVGPVIVGNTGCVYSETVNYRIVCLNNTGSGYPAWDDRVYGIYTYSNGSTQEYTCSVSGGNSGNVSSQYTDCGYVVPTCSGAYRDSSGFSGSCSGGQKCTFYNWYDSCGNYVKTTQGSCVDCCTAAGPYGCKTTYTSLNKGYTTCTYRRTNCTTYTTTTNFCNEYCSTRCGSCVRIGGGVGSYKSCTKTCECAGTSSYSVKC
jgi:hypothetical protein